MGFCSGISKSVHPSILQVEWSLGLENLPRLQRVGQPHRDKDVDFNSWLALQTWRSDGEPAAHSTFALVAMNLKMKTALVKQGLYCLNISGMDLETTAEEIKHSVDDDELQKQLNDLVKRYCVTNDYYIYHLHHTLQTQLFSITRCHLLQV